MKRLQNTAFQRPRKLTGDPSVLARLVSYSICSLTPLIIACSQEKPNTPYPRVATFQQQLDAVRSGEQDGLFLGPGDVDSSHFVQLRDLPTLRELSIDGVGVNGPTITSQDILQLQELGGLEVLKLRHIAIDDLGLEHVCRFATLRVLNLPHADLTDRGLELLKRLPNLSLLRLGSRRVTDRGIKAVSELGELKSVHLIDIPISDAGLEHLLNMEQLQSLYVDGGNLSERGIKRIFERRPNLHVHLDQEHHDWDPQRHIHERVPKEGE